ncbi:MAG TPA: winged helix-turn-helix domain-containing protein [Cerasibacillus sp.]|uniref:winged helix-turn-helix domain-containing protein n=1 Tax=Cerasibacillus sp. TaxID=2498711 RepID=UPI002F3F856D
MACVNDTQLSETDKKILAVIENKALLTEKITEEVGLPLFKIRSRLRELKSNGYIIEKDSLYQINPTVKEE